MYLSENVGSIARSSSRNFLVKLTEIVEEALRVERSELGVVDCTVSARPGHVVGDDIDHERLNLFQGLAMCQTKRATKKKKMFLDARQGFIECGYRCIRVGMRAGRIAYHVASVDLLCERLEIVCSAELGVERVQVNWPVAVITCAFLGHALDLGSDWRNPDL